MKVCYEGGLKVLAMASGYRAETLKSLANASNLKRTHAFLMQVWGTFYRRFLTNTCFTVSQKPYLTVLASIKARLLQCSESVRKIKHMMSTYRLVQPWRVSMSQCTRISLPLWRT